jgi:WD40 repeat protein
VGLMFSPDGKYIASRNLNDVIIRDVQSGKTIAKLELTGLASGMMLDFSPDGQYFAVYNGKGITRIWDIDSHQEVATIKQGQIFMMGLKFSPDGRYLATLADEKLSLWPRDPKEMISEALDRLTRNMDQEESSRFLGLEQGLVINHNFSATWINSILTESIRNNTPVLIASPASSSPREIIRLKYSNASGNRGDWIALYPIGETSENYDKRYEEYLYGKVSGELSFIAPEEEGLYQFRLFADWPNYDAIAISNSIRVSRAG